MELDPGIHVVMHSVLSLKTGCDMDGNNQLLPVAFAFVESENTDNWYWFLKMG
jgi:hypothetical protein